MSDTVSDSRTRLRTKWRDDVPAIPACRTGLLFAAMGAWGFGIYDNDDAADWADSLPVSGLDAVRAALDVVLDAGYVESPDGACALAAADVVARLKSGGGDDSPYCEGVVSWVASNPGRPTDELVDKALRSVARVRGEGSELGELWSEGGGTEKGDWLATISEVERRLA